MEKIDTAALDAIDNDPQRARRLIAKFEGLTGTDKLRLLYRLDASECLALFRASPEKVDRQSAAICEMRLQREFGGEV